MFCGIDWAEDHHDVALVDADGVLVSKRRIDDSAHGFAELLAMLADAGDTAADPIPVAIETPRGLLVANLRQTGRRVYSINPMAVARYRERHTVSRKKSDHVDAMALANILRTDVHAHRPLPADSELVQAIAVLSRATQDAIWGRSRAAQELRAVLREYYPGFLAAFAKGGATNLASAEARGPGAGADTRRCCEDHQDAHRRGTAAGRPPARYRRLGGAVARRASQATAAAAAAGRGSLRPPVARAAGHSQRGVRQRGPTHRVRHRSVPAAPGPRDHHKFSGLANLSGARVLGEIGDDRARFTDARSLKAYAGSAPVNRGPVAASPSPAARSRTTASTPPASSGLSPASAEPERHATTTTAAEHTATGTPPPCDTCSTASSDSSTTAFRPAKHTTQPRLSTPHSAHQPQPQLDS